MQHKICCVFVVYDSKNIEKVVEFFAQSPFAFFIIKILRLCKFLI